MAGNGYKTNAPLLCMPSAADGISVTPSGIASTYSDWTEIVAASPATMRIASIMSLPGFRAFGNHYAIQIGIGADGSEVAVAEIRGQSGNNAGGNADADDCITLAIPCDVITIGDRISCRLKQVSTDTTDWLVSFQYWELPLQPIGGSNMIAASVGPKYYPTATLATAVTAGAGSYGSWVEFSASIRAPWIIGHILYNPSNFQHLSIQIGIGASGHETVYSTINTEAAWFNSSNAWQGGPWNILLRPTLGVIPAGTRVSVRTRKDNTGGTGISIALGVYEQSISNFATSLQLNWVPTAADGYFVQVPSVNGTGTVPSLSSANFAAWTEFIASTATKIAIVNLVTTVQDQTGACWIQIGKGSAGNEVVIQNILTGYGIFGGGNFNIPLPYATVVDVNERISIRIAIQDNSSGRVKYLGIGYLVLTGSEPDFANYTTDLVQAFYNQSGTSTGLLAWQSGAWVVIDSNVPVDRVITAFGAFENPASCEIEIDFGIGTLGNEEVVNTFRYSSGAVASAGSTYYGLFSVPFIIPAGSRLVIRSRCSLATVQSIKTTLHYTAEPDSPFVPVTLSGLYYLLTPTDTHAASRRHDTLYTAYDPVTTENVKIPNPSFALGLIGDE